MYIFYTFFVEMDYLSILFSSSARISSYPGLPRSAYSFGYLVYFFEIACAISGYMLGVNPFNQPGVEEYKKNMFALLGKPGYEDMKSALESRIFGK